MKWLGRLVDLLRPAVAPPEDLPPPPESTAHVLASTEADHDATLRRADRLLNRPEVDSLLADYRRMDARLGHERR